MIADRTLPRVEIDFFFGHCSRRESLQTRRSHPWSAIPTMDAIALRENSRSGVAGTWGDPNAAGPHPAARTTPNGCPHPSRLSTGRWHVRRRDAGSCPCAASGRRCIGGRRSRCPDRAGDSERASASGRCRSTAQSSPPAAIRISTDHGRQYRTATARPTSASSGRNRPYCWRRWPRKRLATRSRLPRTLCTRRDAPGGPLGYDTARWVFTVSRREWQLEQQLEQRYFPFWCRRLLWRKCAAQLLLQLPLASRNRKNPSRSVVPQWSAWRIAEYNVQWS